MALTQQAHHIIPVEFFKDNLELARTLKDVFGLDNITDFQQVGNNFIYLESDAAKAENLKGLLKDNTKIEISKEVL